MISALFVPPSVTMRQRQSNSLLSNVGAISLYSVFVHVSVLHLFSRAIIELQGADNRVHVIKNRTPAFLHGMSCLTASFKAGGPMLRMPFIATAPVYSISSRYCKTGMYTLKYRYVYAQGATQGTGTMACLPKLTKLTTSTHTKIHRPG